MDIKFHYYQKALKETREEEVRRKLQESQDDIKALQGGPDGSEQIRRPRVNSSTESV